MKLNELKKMTVAADMPMGKNEVVFKKIDYRIDKETEDITGVFVHIENYRPLFLPFFASGDNFQLDLLLNQLGCTSYDPDEVNKAAGTVIVAHRYVRETAEQTYTNVSFNANYAEAQADILA